LVNFVIFHFLVIPNADEFGVDENSSVPDKNDSGVGRSFNEEFGIEPEYRYVCFLVWYLVFVIDKCGTFLYYGFFLFRENPFIFGNDGYGSVFDGGVVTGDLANVSTQAVLSYIRNAYNNGADDCSSHVEIGAHEIQEFQIPGFGNELQSDSVLGKFYVFDFAEINVFSCVISFFYVGKWFFWMFLNAVKMHSFS